MFDRRLSASAVLLAAVACADAHDPPARCPDGMCPAGQVCLPDEGALCVATCDAATVSRCENGARCRMWMGGGICWPGRAVVEGAEPAGPYDCAFGLHESPDYEAEPFRFVCEPVCNTNEDCRAGERCDGVMCVAPCRGSTGEPCATTSYCVTNTRPGICVNERRFTRIDCNGDRDLVPECTPSLMCDPEDPARCLHVPPGEE